MSSLETENDKSPQPPKPPLVEKHLKAEYKADLEKLGNNFKGKKPSEASLKRAKKAELDQFPYIIDDLDDWLKHQKFQQDYKIKLRELKLKEKDAESERKLRVKFHTQEINLKGSHAEKAYNLTVGWIMLLALLIYANTLGDSRLTPQEYMATVGGLSVTILSSYLVIIRHLFPKGK